MKSSMKQLVEAWSQVLKLSLVKPEETVCILTRRDIYEENLAAAEFALELIGAKFFKIEPSSPYTISPTTRSSWRP